MPYYTKNTLNRIERMFHRLQQSYYAPVADLEVTAYVTAEPVPYADRFQGTEKTLHIGDLWGGVFDCAWFHFQGRLPEACQPDECSLMIDVSGEGLCVDRNGNPLIGITNGSVAFENAASRKRSVPLKLLRITDGVIDLWMDAGCNGLFGNDCGGRLLEANISRRKEELRSLYYDFFVLKETMEQLSDDSARYHSILHALNSVCSQMDQFSEEEAKAARRLLAPELGKSGGDASLHVTAIGHAHIDLAWLWPIRETIRKGARTLATVDRLLDLYPEYKFGVSQPQLLYWMKEFYPELYKRVQKRVKEGRIECQGAMWVECDTNLAGEESLVRQILYGARFWKEEFEFDVDNIWLPDVFGYSAALPQIMKKSGLKYFMTQKLSWSEHNQFPHHTFHWKGIDGTSVLAHMLPEGTYNSQGGPAAIHQAEIQYLDKGVSDQALLLFGIGDGGGGPGTSHLEKLGRLHDMNGLPQMEQGFAKDFFAKLEEHSKDYAAWKGELYLEFHRGTYTSQARNKRYNRKMEFQLRELEYAASLAMFYTGAPYPKELLDSLWREVLLYQFHDILPGSSIKRVYDECLERYAIILKQAKEQTEHFYQLLANGVTAFNSLSFPRKEYIQSEDGWHLVDMPAMGSIGLGAPIETFEGIEAGENYLDNEYLHVAFGENGTIVSIYDKVNQREALEGTANQFLIYDDGDGDAWDIRIYYDEKQPKGMKLASSDIRVQGPNAYAQQVFAWGDSLLRQKVILQKGCPYVVFDTEVDWNETEKMLRTSFPTAIHEDEAVCNIQFGSIKRPTHRNTSWDMSKFEICAHKWIDLSNDDYGVAVLNDCKYGYKALDNILDLNLLRSSMHPGADADKAKHAFRYAFYPHSGNEKHAMVEQKALAFNMSPAVVSGKGTVGIPESFLRVDCANVEIVSVKKAEDSECLVVRLYQTDGTHSCCHVSLPEAIRQAALASLLEKEEEALEILDHSIELKFRPFEIHTVILTR